MSSLALHSKIEGLPDHLQQQVLDYIEFLLSRERKWQQPSQQPSTPPNPQFKAGFGGAKGRIKLSPDWNEPLEDFKEYM